jgi:hypothetical protein
MSEAHTDAVGIITLLAFSYCGLLTVAQWVATL